jgi:UDP-N-acetylglucosamine:LPS N-acetylglucosamine transferase
MSIPAELRNARMLVNRGHGDVSDEPDPLHEAAADEIERLDRELEALEKTNEHLRAALKRIIDLRHLSSTREMAEIAAFALRTPLRSLPMSEKVRP